MSHHCHHDYQVRDNHVRNDLVWSIDSKYCLHLVKDIHRKAKKKITRIYLDHHENHHHRRRRRRYRSYWNAVRHNHDLYDLETIVLAYRWIGFVTCFIAIVTNGCWTIRWTIACKMTCLIAAITGEKCKWYDQAIKSGFLPTNTAWSIVGWTSIAATASSARWTTCKKKSKEIE